MPHPRRKCYPRSYHNRQSGEGIADLLKPLAKFLGPLILGEAAKFGISKGIKAVAGKKKKRGRGFAPAGAGLKLAGQGRKRKPRKRRHPARKPVSAAVMKARMARVRAFKR